MTMIKWTKIIFSIPARRFSTLSSKIGCWKCQANFNHNEIVCPSCNSISKPASHNFFDVLRVDRKYQIDLQKAQNNFRQLQSIVHPDKFSNASKDEQDNSADWSSLLNKAYSTLSNPIKRGEYILKEQNVKIPETNESVDVEFLAEMMEKNEEVADLETREDIEEYLSKVDAKVNDLIEELGKTLESGDEKAAVAVLVRMRYNQNLQTKLKSKMYGLS